MEDSQLTQIDRKVEQLQKIQPVLEALYEELCEEGCTDEAEAIFVALVRASQHCQCLRSDDGR